MEKTPGKLLSVKEYAMTHIAKTLLVAALSTAAVANPAAGASFTTIYTTTSGPPVALAAAGETLYGTVLSPYCYSVYELQPPANSGSAWTFTTIYTFTGSGGNIACALTGPVVGAHGDLYGVYAQDAEDSTPVMYELQPPAAPGGAWTESVALSSDLLGPELPSLVKGPDGSFYGLSAGGLVQLFPPAEPGLPWSGVLLWAIGSCETGFGRSGPLVVGPDGSVYGVNDLPLCYPNSKGNVFQLTPPVAPGGPWNYQVIHNFEYADKLGNPYSLALGEDGTLYGATLGSGAGTGVPGDAAVYQLQPPTSGSGEWTYTVLKNFGPVPWMEAPLLLQNGNLYGSFFVMGDEITDSAVFEMRPPSAPGGAWTTTYLHEWVNGQIPVGNLLVDNDGAIFGTTSEQCAGSSCTGTVFQITTK
jgi:hypothetical protein